MLYVLQMIRMKGRWWEVGNPVRRSGRRAQGPAENRRVRWAGGLSSQLSKIIGMGSHREGSKYVVGKNVGKWERTELGLELARTGNCDLLQGWITVD